jgi:DnaJ homolog subfamily C member 11
MGEPKTLRVRYLFRSRLHEVSVDDVSGLRAPLRAHAIEGARDTEWEL